MKLKHIDKIKSKEQAKQIAIGIQKQLSKCSLYYSEIVNIGEYLEDLAKKFNLEEELKENGLI